MALVYLSENWPSWQHSATNKTLVSEWSMVWVWAVCQVLMLCALVSQEGCVSCTGNAGNPSEELNRSPVDERTAPVRQTGAENTPRWARKCSLGKWGSRDVRLQREGFVWASFRNPLWYFDPHFHAHLFTGHLIYVLFSNSFVIYFLFSSFLLYLCPCKSFRAFCTSVEPFHSSTAFHTVFCLPLILTVALFITSTLLLLFS